MTASMPPSAVAILLLTGLTVWFGPAMALDLTMPGPVAAVETRNEAAATLELPVGPFADGILPTRRVEGVLDQRAYRLDTPGLSLTQLGGPLRAQVEAQGFAVIFDCETRVCGGFDFRFALDVMPEPAMHVDLGEFRFLSAQRGAEVVGLLISRSPSAGFVQVTRVGVEAMPAPEVPEIDPARQPEPAVVSPPVAPLTPAEPVTLPDDLIGQMVAVGSVPLDDLIFASGAAVLEPGDYASLAVLAVWLAEDPARSIMLVGHSDGSGGLKANVGLSKKRAEGVRQALLKMPGVAAGQVAAEGAGPIAPRATNLSEDGRRKNRRVEAVMTSTQ